MAIQDRYFYGSCRFLFLLFLLAQVKPCRWFTLTWLGQVIGTGGMAERQSAYPHQTEGLTMDVRILFLTAQSPLPLAPFVPCWKRNRDRYQPLAAHGWATKGCPYRRSWRRMPVCVCPNKSDRHIRAYFFLWGFGLFTLSSEPTS